jgi:hypothetical protein
MGEPVGGTSSGISSRRLRVEGHGPDNARPSWTGAPTGGRGKALTLALLSDGGEGSATRGVLENEERGARSRTSPAGGCEEKGGTGTVEDGVEQGAVEETIKPAKTGLKVLISAVLKRA